MSELITLPRKVATSIESGIEVMIRQYGEWASALFDYAEDVEANLKKLSIKPVRHAHEDLIKDFKENCNELVERLNQLAEGLIAIVDEDKAIPPTPPHKSLDKVTKYRYC